MMCQTLGRARKETPTLFSAFLYNDRNSHDVADMCRAREEYRSCSLSRSTISYIGNREREKLEKL